MFYNAAICRWFMAATLLVTLVAQRAEAVSYTWDGTGDGITWSDPLNWTADSGFPNTTSDIATFTGAANITAGLPQTINRLFTGAGLVQLGGSLNFGPNVSPNGPVIGAGGLVVNGSLGNQMRDFSSSGNVTINGSLNMFAFFPVQTGGTWDITTINLPNNSGNIAAWNISDGANTTITNSFTSATYTWTGTPVISGGRPNWIFNSGGDGGTILQLGSQTIFGNQLSLGSWPPPGATRHTELQSNGGTIDVNVLNIQPFTAGPGSFINMDNGTINIQGLSGLVWNNQSGANTQFDVRTNTTVTFAAGAFADIDTGSDDAGLFAASFVNNFAFDDIQIPVGASIRLTGGDYLGGLVNALYATNITGGGTLRLNGHNVYLLNEAGNDVVFNFAGGGQIFYLNLIPVPEPSTLALLGLGSIALVIKNRRRRATRG